MGLDVPWGKTNKLTVKYTLDRLKSDIKTRNVRLPASPPNNTPSTWALGPGGGGGGGYARVRALRTECPVWVQRKEEPLFSPSLWMEGLQIELFFALTRSCRPALDDATFAATGRNLLGARQDGLYFGTLQSLEPGIARLIPEEPHATNSRHDPFDALVSTVAPVVGIDREADKDSRHGV